MADVALQPIASRLVKEIASYGGVIDRFVPKTIAAEVRERIAAGEDPVAVRAFFVERYGDWVSFVPPARQETALNGLLTAELLTADDGRLTADDVQIQDGGVSLEALSGTYVLRLAESDAARLGVLPQSEPFTLPSREETIAFAAAQTRL